MGKVIRKIKTNEEELNEKDVEVEAAKEMIKKLKKRLMKNGEEWDESDDDVYDDDDEG